MEKIQILPDSHSKYKHVSYIKNYTHVEKVEEIHTKKFYIRKKIEPDYAIELLIDEMLRDVPQVSYISEILKGGDLNQFKNNKKEIPEEEILNYFLQLCDILLSIHNKGIIHRDIKPANLLLSDDSKLTLCDFGVAFIQNNVDQSPSTMVGTRQYMAPEQYTDNESYRIYTKSVDIWSFGICLYEMMYKKRPFEMPIALDGAKKLREMINCDKSIEFPFDNYYSKELQDLLHSILLKNPLKRPSLNKIKAELQIIQSKYNNANPIQVHNSEFQQAKSCPSQINPKFNQERGEQKNDDEEKGGEDQEEEEKIEISFPFKSVISVNRETSISIHSNQRESLTKIIDSQEAQTSKKRYESVLDHKEEKNSFLFSQLSNEHNMEQNLPEKEIVFNEIKNSKYEEIPKLLGDLENEENQFKVNENFSFIFGDERDVIEPKKKKFFKFCYSVLSFCTLMGYMINVSWILATTVQYSNDLKDQADGYDMKIIQNEFIYVGNSTSPSTNNNTWQKFNSVDPEFLKFVHSPFGFVTISIFLFCTIFLILTHAISISFINIEWSPNIFEKLKKIVFCSNWLLTCLGLLGYFNLLEIIFLNISINDENGSVSMDLNEDIYQKNGILDISRYLLFILVFNLILNCLIFVSKYETRKKMMVMMIVLFIPSGFIFGIGCHCFNLSFYKESDNAETLALMIPALCMKLWEGAILYYSIISK